MRIHKTLCTNRDWKDVDASVTGRLSAFLGADFSSEFSSFSISTILYFNILQYYTLIYYNIILCIKIYEIQT